MPLYEEKLLNPLAIRFTQSFVRKTFQNGTSLDEAITQIESLPGNDRYDLILKAPFPLIEVVRWSPKTRTGSPELPEWSRETGDLWFSFDNRRLCCLQRAAAAMWPKRVGIAVEVLYTRDMNAIWKKCTTTNCGRNVNYGTSTKDAADGVWDWRAEAAQQAAGVDVGLRVAASAAVTKDEQSSIEDLVDALSESSSVLRLLQAATAESTIGELPVAVVPAAPANRERSRKNDKQCVTPTTRDGSEESEQSSGSVQTPRGTEKSAAANPTRGCSPIVVAAEIADVWVGRDLETYTIKPSGHNYWTCMRKDQSGSKRFTLSFDEYEGRLWWGNTGKFFVEVKGSGKMDRMMWYCIHDGGRRRRPRFAWRRQCDVEDSASA